MNSNLFRLGGPLTKLAIGHIPQMEAKICGIELTFIDYGFIDVCINANWVDAIGSFIGNIMPSSNVYTHLTHAMALGRFRILKKLVAFFPILPRTKLMTDAVGYNQIWALRQWYRPGYAHDLMYGATKNGNIQMMRQLSNFGVTFMFPLYRDYVSPSALIRVTKFHKKLNIGLSSREHMFKSALRNGDAKIAKVVRSLMSISERRGLYSTELFNSIDNHEIFTLVVRWGKRDI